MKPEEWEVDEGVQKLEDSMGQDPDREAEQQELERPVMKEWWRRRQGSNWSSLESFYDTSSQEFNEGF